MVQVWTIPQQLPADASLPALLAELDDAGRARHARLVTATLRERYLATHVAARRILGALLGCAPATLPIRHGVHGKPALPAPWSFNLSHSGGYALLAVAHGGELGVDIEQMRADIDAAAISARYFHPAERAALAALAADARREAFFRCWTRKEAYLKAVGVGLAGGLAQCRVSLDHEHAALLEVAWDPAEADRWWMASWQPRPGYAAALCVAQPRAAVVFHEWQP